MAGDDTRTFAGARRPDRFRRVDSGGLSIATYEWGDEAAPPLLLVHGGMDFAGTFDVFAPKLADAGWRVVAFDQRGHGDSEHATCYSWDADIRDTLAVIDSVTPGPLPIVGHSKGGGLMLQLADACPHRVTKLVNIDGMPSRRGRPDVSDHERTRLMSSELIQWLDHRQRSVDAQRKPGTIEDLAQRRAVMNPRLPIEWLEYLVTIGARKDDEGWRWKIDPVMRFGGFGPWRPEWSLYRLVNVGVPLLGMIATVPERMSMGSTLDDVEPYLPPGAHVEVFDDSGHFIHIEQPDRVSQLVLEFLS
ncbi:MAG: alpha/beta hydrolase [Acidimicrobiales bacterium]|nr:alpha/beta hydrolase [Acidimicrobiales bacterium]